MSWVWILVSLGLFDEGTPKVFEKERWGRSSSGRAEGATFEELHDLCWAEEFWKCGNQAEGDERNSEKRARYLRIAWEIVRLGQRWENNIKIYLRYVGCIGLDWIDLQSLLVTWCTTSLTFNNCTLCQHCIYVFCIYLRTNSGLCHLQHKLIGFYNRDEKCLQRGTDWVFK